jgi:hypothetical protein
VYFSIWNHHSPHCRFGRIPREDEESQKGANENADDEVAVVVHDEQHDEVRYTELNHVHQGSDWLLRKTRQELMVCRDRVARATHQRSGVGIGF